MKPIEEKNKLLLNTNIIIQLEKKIIQKYIDALNIEL